MALRQQGQQLSSPSVDRTIPAGDPAPPGPAPFCTLLPAACQTRHWLYDYTSLLQGRSAFPSLLQYVKQSNKPGRHYYVNEEVDRIKAQRDAEKLKELLQSKCSAVTVQEHHWLSCRGGKSGECLALGVLWVHAGACNLRSITPVRGSRSTLMTKAMISPRCREPPRRAPLQRPGQRCDRQPEPVSTVG